MNAFRKIFVVVAALAPAKLFACAACYANGASINDPMAAGMNWAIFTLGVVVATVLGTFLAFLIYAIRKSEAVEAARQSALPERSQRDDLSPSPPHTASVRSLCEPPLSLTLSPFVPHGAREPLARDRAELTRLRVFRTRLLPRLHPQWRRGLGRGGAPETSAVPRTPFSQPPDYHATRKPALSPLVPRGAREIPAPAKLEQPAARTVSSCGAAAGGLPPVKTHNPQFA